MAASKRSVELTKEIFGDEVGWPAVLKTTRGGYDGKGVRVIADTHYGADRAQRILERRPAP